MENYSHIFVSYVHWSQCQEERTFDILGNLSDVRQLGMVLNFQVPHKLCSKLPQSFDEFDNVVQQELVIHATTFSCIKHCHSTCSD